MDSFNDHSDISWSYSHKTFECELCISVRKICHSYQAWPVKFVLSDMTSKICHSYQTWPVKFVLSDMTSKIWENFAKDWHKIGILQ